MGSRRSMKSMKSIFEEILVELEKSDPDIEASALVRGDGLILAASLPGDVDKTLVAAITAAVFNIGNRALEELKRGNFKELFIRGENGLICLMKSIDGSILSTIVRPEANIGLVLVKMREAAQKILKRLSKGNKYGWSRQ